MPVSKVPCVLIVEDEFLVAMDLEETFLGESWNVLGPVPDVMQALAMLQTHKPDVVCLDMNLSGNPSTPIAEELQKLGIPFVVLTGYSAASVTDPAYKGARIVHKPFLAAELVSALASAMR
jgi:AmiR/NasT family two-component response regulator